MTHTVVVRIFLAWATWIRSVWTFWVFASIAPLFFLVFFLFQCCCKANLLMLRLLESVTLFNKLLNLSFKSIKFLAITIIWLHFPILFSYNFLDSFLLFRLSIEHTSGQCDIVEAFFSQKIEKRSSFGVSFLQCKKFFQFFGRIVVSKWIQFSSERQCLGP